MILTRILSPCLLAASALLPLSAATVRESLPEDTMLMVEVPSPAAFSAKFRATRFGAMLFSPERTKAWMDLFKKANPGDWEKMSTKLTEAGMTVDDLMGLFSSRFGMAMSMPSPDTAKSDDAVSEHEPIFTMWAEPGAEMVGKIMKALSKPEDNPKTRTVEETIGGKKALVGTPNPDYKPSDAKKEEDANELPSKTSPDMTMIVVADGARIVAFTSKSTHNNALRAVAAKTISRLDGDGRGGFIAANAATPFLAEQVLGTQAMELVFDHRPLLKLAKTDEQKEQAERIIKAMGIENSKGASLRMSIDDAGLVRTQFRMHLPGPRKGLAALWDGISMPARKLPTWMSADMIMGGVFALDLSKVRTCIHEIAAAAEPDGAQSLVMGEGMAAGFLGVTIEDLLASMKPDISFGQFADAKKSKPSGDADSGADESEHNERFGVVIPLSNVAPWQTLLRKLPAMIGRGAAELVDEPEQVGIRMKKGDVESLGVFVASNALIIGAGAGVADMVLANVAKPPTGEAALAGTEWAKRALAMLSAQPGIGLSIENQEKTVNDKLVAALKMLENLPMVDMPAELMEKAIPKPSEMKGTWDISASSVRMTSEGMSLDGIMHLPLAK